MNPTLYHEIRDPIYGAVRFSRSEYQIINHRFVQRLRGIRQLGFTHYPFPGATHTRFCHSIGIMHLAGVAFESVFRDHPFKDEEHARQLKHCVRMAALLHDLGHGPYSHAAEFAMPKAHTLKVTKDLNRKASHEDYTVAILLFSDLCSTIGENFSFDGRHVAGLIDTSLTVPDDFFRIEGFDLRGILSQLISSNLDVDRLDYLVRDSFFSGTKYGQVDVHWLVSHLSRHIDDEGNVYLALERNAIYAFEDFLLSRLQMFLNVYFHPKSIAYELMFQQVLNSEGCTYVLPSDLDEYLFYDDSHLWQYVRTSEHPFAKRIVSQNQYKVVFERHGTPQVIDLHARQLALKEAGINVLIGTSIGVAYQNPKSRKKQIYGLGRALEGVRKAVPLSQLCDIRSEICISRLFVPKEQLVEASAIMQSMDSSAEQYHLF
ncbi:MAG: HD domain-containing protein [Myxococcota bacterium]|nr:HD domain-containing protein [Myxococcota bacterium]